MESWKIQPMTHANEHMKESMNLGTKPTIAQASSPLYKLPRVVIKGTKFPAHDPLKLVHHPC